MNCLIRTVVKIGLMTLAGFSALFLMHHGFAVGSYSNASINKTLDLQLDPAITADYPNNNSSVHAVGANGLWHNSANFKNGPIPIPLGANNIFWVKYQGQEYQCQLENNYPFSNNTATLKLAGADLTNPNMNGVSCALYHPNTYIPAISI